jgi:hypothetical protein
VTTHECDHTPKLYLIVPNSWIPFVEALQPLMLFNVQPVHPTNRHSALSYSQRQSLHSFSGEAHYTAGSQVFLSSFQDVGETFS